jgi:RND family efflux transporter MFP subunit
MPEPAEELRRNLTALRLERRESSSAPRSRRPLVVGGAVALVVVGLVVYRLMVGRPATVEVVRLSAPTGSGEHGTELPVLSGAGYVVSADRYISIGVRVAGRIDRYLIEEGDHVRAGDPLVQLDARDYEAAVQRAEANLRAARAAAVLERTQLARARALAADGVLSRDTLDLQIAETDSAEARIAQAEAELQQARVALEYTTLRAPRNGVILAKLKEVGEIAVPGGFAGSGDLVRMANLEDLRGQVDVTESELTKVHLGQRAEVVPDAYPGRRYPARVVKLYPQVDRQKGTLRVEVQVEKPDESLWPDMSARITFLEPLGTDGRSGLALPAAALRGDPQAPFAWVVVDGRVRRAPLSVGRTLGDQVEVTSGVAEGDLIVIGTLPALAEGQAVTTTPHR